MLKPYIFKAERPESVSFSSKRPAEERRKLAERLKKNIYEAQIFEDLQFWQVEVRCLVCKINFRSYVRRSPLT